MRKCTYIRKLFGLNNHALTPPTFPSMMDICMYICIYILRTCAWCSRGNNSSSNSGGASSVEKSTMRERQLQCIILMMVERYVQCVRSLMKEWLSISVLTSLHLALLLCNILFSWKLEPDSSSKC